MAVAVKDPPRRARVAPARVKQPARRMSRLRRDAILVALMVPALVWLLVFPYGALFGNVIAFKDYVPFLGVWQSPWVGFGHFERLLGDPRFWDAAANTVSISVLQIVFYFPAALGLALLLHSLAGATVRRWVQSVVYLPHFITWVIVVALFQQMLSGTGVLNGWLTGAGLEPVHIIGNPDAYKPLVIFQYIWKECGWGTIIFLAALYQVDDQLYEAAAMDGAGWWRRLWHVTLPAIRPVMVLLLVLKLGEILSVGFEQFYLQREAVGPEAGEVLDTFVFFTGFSGGDLGYAAAAGLFKGVVGAVLIYTANRVAHRLGEQGIYQS
ncbi:MAG TPA: ABC transporter permease subunit [Candidatus Limnocylindrales bacterium]